MKIIRKDINIAIACGLVFAVLFSLSKFDASCEQLRENILRLHIIANSNTAEDQTLKYKVRDSLLEVGTDVFGEDLTLQQAIDSANSMIPLLQKIAEETIRESGYNYPVEISVGKAYFGTRVYETFTLPAGEYDAVRVKIGQAKGKNWWCVMFPAMCVPASADHSLDEVVDGSATDIAENSSKYQVKFKSVELYENLKHSVSKLFSHEN